MATKVETFPIQIPADLSASIAQYLAKYMTGSKIQHVEFLLLKLNSILDEITAEFPTATQQEKKAQMDAIAVECKEAGRLQIAMPAPDLVTDLLTPN